MRARNRVVPVLLLAACSAGGLPTSEDAVAACHGELEQRGVQAQAPWRTTSASTSAEWRINVWTAAVTGDRPQGLPSYVCDVERDGASAVRVVQVRP